MHRLETGNVLRLKAFGAFLDFKFHCLTFVERFVPIHHDRGEMNENIFAGLTLDKTIALRSVEPLHCSLFLHFHYLARAFPTKLGPRHGIALLLLVGRGDGTGLDATVLLPRPLKASDP
jgi:hypothetical protein